jgi:hypothetical protein
VVDIVQAGVATGMPSRLCMAWLLARYPSLPEPCTAVSCKMRVHADLDRTVALAQRLESAGLTMLTIEGRTCEQQHDARGVADWMAVKTVR